MVYALLSAKASVNVRDSRGLSALHWSLLMEQPGCEEASDALITTLVQDDRTNVNQAPITTPTSTPRGTLQVPMGATVERSLDAGDAQWQHCSDGGQSQGPPGTHAEPAGRPGVLLLLTSNSVF